MTSQRHFVFIWELGNDLGHFTTLLPVMSALLVHGHRVTFITRNVEEAGQVGLDKRIALIQAPIWHRRGRVQRITWTQADILLDMGYDNAEGLAATVGAWRHLYALLQPDMVIYNYAPTAMLAWRHHAVPKVLLGNAFYSPAPAWPSVNLCYWLEGHTPDIEGIDARFMASIKSGVADTGRAGLHHPSDIFVVDQAFFLGFPEFDIYRYQREVGIYLGHFGTVARFPDPDWPTGSGMRVFAYLKAGQRHAKTVMQALSSMPGVRAVCYYSGAQEDVAQWQSDTLRIVSTPVNMARVLESAELVICHAGAGTVFEALSAGVPLMLLPIQIEQIHHAITAESLGLGVAVKTHDTPDIVNSKLRRAVTDRSLKDNAARFAASHGGSQYNDPAAFIADWCEAELARVA